MKYTIICLFGTIDIVDSIYSRMMHPLPWPSALPRPASLAAMQLRFESRKMLASSFLRCGLYRGGTSSAVSVRQVTGQLVGCLKARVTVLPGWQRFDVLRRRQAAQPLESRIRKQGYKVRVYVLRYV